MELFGYQITKRLSSKRDIEKDIKSFAPKPEEDGVSSTVAAGGYYGQYVDLDGSASSNDQDLIIKYREAARQPECDSAVSDIVDAVIASRTSGSPCEIDLTELEQPDSIKKKIVEEFGNILSLYKFNKNAEQMFRQWYIDGRIYFHIIIDEKSPKRGILEIRPIESTFMKKVKEIQTETDTKTNATIQKVVSEYYIYSEQYSHTGATVTAQSQAGGKEISGVKIAKDAVINVTSGLLDASQQRVVSYLHKALKPVNQLRMMEDSLVMYRVARAPERRIFYIDVGNLPKGKAEEYVQSIMSKYRNKLVYDAATGDIKDDRRHMSMLEDFWLPRREGGRGTEITTLPGGENLGQIDDIVFFQRKLYKTLNVPISRLDSETSFSLGRSSEITRDEVKFQKFVDRIRKKFSSVLLEALKVQLILKGIIGKDEWEDLASDMAVSFIEDNYFAELKESEILTSRIEMLDLLGENVGKYYSTKWIRNNILKQSDEDIERIDAEIAEEKPEEGADDDMGFESVEASEEDIIIDEEVNNRTEELHEAQIKMIDTMSKILDD
jgi:hypothetical protein